MTERITRRARRRAWGAGAGFLAAAAAALAVAVASAPDAPDEKRVETLLERRAALDTTVWAPEREAQHYERVFIELWDRLRGSTDPLRLLARAPFRTIRIGTPRLDRELELGVRAGRLVAPWSDATRSDAAALAERLVKLGYRLEQSEWHHGRFEPPGALPDGSRMPAASTVSVALHLRRDGETDRRVILRGSLEVVWREEPDERGLPVVDTVDASGLRLYERDGPPAFEPLPALTRLLATTLPRGRSDVLPVLVYDLDEDGLSEIVALGVNRVLRNEGGGRFRAEPLVDEAFRVRGSAVLADFDGDGHADLVAAGQDGRLLLFEGSPSGRFSKPGRACAEMRFDYPKAYTAGDVDGDGDLDLFVGQYKHPYHDGSMPTPFYDANDGHPAALLVNDGAGRFVDATERAGLGDKRRRRTYSASLVDLDGDVDLDLLVVSDFSGVDVYRNDGRGRFRDVTRRLVDERHLFGMAHALADFDLDGRLDVYAIGMSSTTARRLERLGLAPGARPDVTRMRPIMGYGNRMYLHRGRRLRQAAFNDDVARTGWSWGTTAIDVDNDADADVYVANGHSSGESAQDYCTRFWSHDIYTGSSEPDPALRQLFDTELSSMGRGETSWNGFEKNVLFVNLGGSAFENVSYLLGAAMEEDSRAVVGTDLDGDGRQDLVVSEFVKGTHGRPNSTRLHVLRNRLDTGRHWIAVRLEEEGLGVSPVGAVVTVRSGRRAQVAALVTGDSFSSQHPLTAHFGLGAAERVDSLEVRWPDGATTRLVDPGVDRVHAVSARGRRP